MNSSGSVLVSVHTGDAEQDSIEEVYGDNKTQDGTHVDVHEEVGVLWYCLRRHLFKTMF